MNLKIKREETLKVDEIIRNEEESLKVRFMDAEKDKDLIKTFINNVK